MIRNRAYSAAAGILIWFLNCLSVAASEPEGFFGLDFGSELPSKHIIDTEDPRFLRAIENLDEDERLVARRQWIEALFEDPVNMSTSVREALEKELAGLNFLYVVDPPVTNEHFVDYIALVTPQSARLGAIWAYGSLDPCAPTIRRLAEHLLDQYTSLEPSWLTKELRHEKLEFVEFNSDNVRISFGCGYMNATHRGLEEEAEGELETIFQKILEKIYPVDTSGL